MVIKVRLYADEIKEAKNRIGQRWMYLGILAVPEELYSHALGELSAVRDEFSYYGEIKSTKLTRAKKINVARGWLESVLSDGKKCFHFYILGLFLDNLVREAFGDKKVVSTKRIYNRFFRSAVLSTLKLFFDGNVPVGVTYVFHDRSDMEYDEIFDWHTIWKIGTSEENILFEGAKIHFLDSDHRKEKIFPDDSHFIQLMDLVLGSTRQCLDYTSEREGIIKAASVLYPLTERLADSSRCNNPNSRYRYHNRCCLSFFPLKKLTPSGLDNHFERFASSFFVDRELLLSQGITGQQTLFRESGGN